MRKVAIFLALVVVAGCETGEPEPTNADLCASYGFEFGTDAYGQCMLRLAEIDQQRRQAWVDYWASNPLYTPTLPPRQPLPLPRQTVCRQIGATVYCDTY